MEVRIMYYPQIVEKIYKLEKTLKYQTMLLSHLKMILKVLNYYQISQVTIIINMVKDSLVKHIR
jgi:hypothetical protein